MNYSEQAKEVRHFSVLFSSERPALDSTELQQAKYQAWQDLNGVAHSHAPADLDENLQDYMRKQIRLALFAKDPAKREAARQVAGFLAKTYNY